MIWYIKKWLDNWRLISNSIDIYIESILLTKNSAWMIREHKGGRICYQKYDVRETTVLDPNIGTETTGIAA